ncbi:EVE domain-containing protein [Desulfonatronum sp. SC1]|uniref:EVE domain-containing protein n=1 Tax=Desulfonatronum sp. SC1 TaxID=2109626 RepID=UPI000D30BBDC|nr:EVE domain-containing protein [Desulfonatronum sp. SC1]PTN38988.1 EVE domain-containing protein [Desulfonatronum sp. SC1]
MPGNIAKNIPRHWLLKSEPNCFSIDDLAAAPDQTTFWDGVRNYQARNLMREMRVGDQALYYHSQTNPSVVGLAEIVREAYPDHTAWDPQSGHFDPRSTREKPLWDMVDIRLVRKFAHPLPLPMLRTVADLVGMELLRKGSRLSVQPVTESQFKTILRLAEEATEAYS